VWHGQALQTCQVRSEGLVEASASLGEGFSSSAQRTNLTSSSITDMQQVTSSFCKIHSGLAKCRQPTALMVDFVSFGASCPPVIAHHRHAALIKFFSFFLR
jgi:hypothetical protein